MKSKLIPFVRVHLSRNVQRLLIVGLLTAVAPTLTADNHPNPGIARPASKPAGHTYGEWGARWWQWILSIPETRNPAEDATGQFSGVDQSGPVFFLGGTFGNSAERTVPVPAGKFVFVPVHIWIFGSAVFDCDPTNPGVPCDLATLREKAATGTTEAEVVEAMIDGVAVRNIRDYRGISPDPLSLTFPLGAVFGIPAGTYYPQVSDGYWLMLTPPEPGKHEIVVHVVNSAAGIDATAIYHLTVQRESEHRGN